jgi:hypothetical protein
MIAASVAATNATLMKVGTANIGVTRFSDISGCGKCLAFADTQTAPGGYIMGNAATSATSYFYGTLSAWVKTEVAGNSIKGDACCKDASTKESAADSALICAKAATAYSATASDDKLHNNIVLAANDFFQSALAKCPHNTTNCVVAVKDAAAAAITPADLRYVKLEKLGTDATLTIKVHKTGTAAGEAGTGPE